MQGAWASLFHFQVLKIEQDSKLEDNIKATVSQFEKHFTNNLDPLQSEINSSIENNLVPADSTASSKLDTTLLTDTLLSSADAKVNEILQHKFDIQECSILNDVDSNAATELSTASKYLSKGLEVVNSNLSTASKAQVMLETLHTNDHTTLEARVDTITKEKLKSQANQSLNEYDQPISPT